jgi:hypothetical protein
MFGAFTLDHLSFEEIRLVIECSALKHSEQIAEANVCIVTCLARLGPGATKAIL